MKRAYIVREVWQTERAYVESLKFTHEVTGCSGRGGASWPFPADTAPHRTRTLPTKKRQAYELGLRDRLTKGSPIASEKYIDAIFYEVRGATTLPCGCSRC